MLAIDDLSVRIDGLAREATAYLFSRMASEKALFVKKAVLAGQPTVEADLFPRLAEMQEGYFTISVGFVGDARGQILLLLSRKLATAVALRVLDVPSLEWIGEDPEETLNDTMGELGNTMVGLVKGGMTKWLPRLTLTTPKVLRSCRLRIESEKLFFRKQYLFAAMGSPVLVDFCYQ